VSTDTRADRLAKNEAAFRAANEKVKEVTQAFGFVSDDRFDFICECADMACTEPVRLALADYEEVRRDPSRFFVKCGHELPDETVEVVVERRDDCFVVEKRNTDVPEQTA
jgi:hypothetical protein